MRPRFTGIPKLHFRRIGQKIVDILTRQNVTVLFNQTAADVAAYSERGVDRMVAKSTREAALRISRAGKAVVEARIAAQALRDDLEKLFARERTLH